MAFDERRVRSQFPILATKVPSTQGRPNPLRYFDHAASTHAPKPVLEAINDLASHGYANVHRANHHLSRVATDAFEAARLDLTRFIGGNATEDVLVFGGNTTSSLELAAFVMSHQRGDVIISHLEHHSNDLPHRRQARVHRVDPGNDLAGLPALIEQTLRKARRVKLVAVTGASNVTGECPDVHAIARIAHEYDAKILVDAAQLLAHKAIDVRSPDAADHLDFVAAAGHKTYAPFGASFLYGPRALFDKAAPFVPGGGTVSLVTGDDALYLKTPDRHEAGTPNVMGAVAFAAATRWLGRLGMDNVHQHEMRLAARMRERAAQVPGLRTYQAARPSASASYP
jgi:selenocysteine lyase/cysteine desulfurase